MAYNKVPLNTGSYLIPAMQAAQQYKYGQIRQKMAEQEMADYPEQLAWARENRGQQRKQWGREDQNAPLDYATKAMTLLGVSLARSPDPTTYNKTVDSLASKFGIDPTMIPKIDPNMSREDFALHQAGISKDLLDFQNKQAMAVEDRRDEKTRGIMEYGYKLDEQYGSKIKSPLQKVLDDRERYPVGSEEYDYLTNYAKRLSEGGGGGGGLNAYQEASMRARADANYGSDPENWDYSTDPATFSPELDREAYVEERMRRWSGTTSPLESDGTETAGGGTSIPSFSPIPTQGAPVQPRGKYDTYWGNLFGLNKPSEAPQAPPPRVRLRGLEQYAGTRAGLEGVGPPSPKQLGDYVNQLELGRTASGRGEGIKSTRVPWGERVEADAEKWFGWGKTPTPGQKTGFGEAAWKSLKQGALGLGQYAGTMGEVAGQALQNKTVGRISDTVGRILQFDPTRPKVKTEDKINAAVSKFRSKEWDIQTPEFENYLETLTEMEKQELARALKSIGVKF